MSRSIGSASAALVALFAPAVAGAAALSIEHQAPACIVVGRTATLRACFAPAAGVASARVHYRLETRDSWSRVEMRADGGCYAGALPALGRDLVGTSVRYTIEAVDRGSQSHRTAEFAPVVVARETECADPAAAERMARPRVSKALVIGGVAAAGVAGVLATRSGSASPTTTVATTPPVGPPVRESPQPPATTPAPGPGGSLGLACQANPRSGTAPLLVAFATFPTGATGSYLYEWSFGDGATSNNPNPSHTYSAAGRFDAVVRVTSGGETATCARDITVTATPTGPNGPTPTPTPIPTPTPLPTPTPPPGRTLTLSTNGNFPGAASSTPAGINCSFPPQSVCTATFSQGTSVTLTGPIIPAGSTRFSGDCVGVTTCTVIMNADKQVAVYFFRSSAQSGAREPRPFAVSSELDVPDAEGRVAVNGGAASPVRHGQAAVTAPARSGANRVEAVLARAAGRPGTWRFDLGASSGFKAGSLRVDGGTVALITTDSVVFRVQGKAGERLVFTFEVED